MTESDKQRAERIAKKLHEIAEQYQNDDVTMLHDALRMAYDYGVASVRRETVEECALLVEGLWEKEHSIILSDECDYVAHEIRALLPAATKEADNG